MNKGQLMQLIYTGEELKNIDASLPINILSELDNIYYFVMNYNDSVFGKLEDMRVISNQRDINIEEK